MDSIMIRLTISEAIDAVAALRITNGNLVLADRIKDAADHAARNQVWSESTQSWVSIPDDES